MSAPLSLIQAALQRLSARIGSGLIDAAASLAVAAQEAPDKLRQELQLFWEEVEAEADRIERHETATPGEEWTNPSQGPASQGPSGGNAWQANRDQAFDPSVDLGTSPATGPATDLAGHAAAAPADPQRQIDSLRALIASLARRLDQQLDQQRLDQR
jgi:hypothetical protein